ncbi:MAG: hypothetical protein JXC85_02280 [Candidatus Aenigmarchaeota archaeon]|nr:hypothetical protein [Candidatus Aenigmarchaeota archaeon]
MFKGLHHFHKRKRIYQYHEPYPHPNKLKNAMDKLIYVVGIAGPVMAIPQLLKIWVEKNVSGVSGITWFAFLIIAIFWMMYGILHREKPIILTYAAWLIMDILIITGLMAH